MIAAQRSRSEIWAIRLWIISAGSGIGSALLWWLIDGDMYTSMAYNSSFCWVQSNEQGWIVFLTALSLGIVSIASASISLFFRRPLLAWIVTGASLLLQPAWWYEVNLTATTTIPAILEKD